MSFTLVLTSEAGAGIEPANSGFADRSLPLGYPAAANFSERKLSGLGVVVSILQRGRLR